MTMSDFNDKLGKRIKQARKELQLTQEELAENCFICLDLISRYERGLVTPSSDSLAKIAVATHVTADWLLFGLVSATETKLHTENIAGNIHDSATLINKRGWAGYLVTIHSTGFNSVAVFKMPSELVYSVRSEDKSYVADPHHDDPKGEAQ